MRKTLRFGLVALVLVGVAGLSMLNAADAKYTISEVMKMAHGKDGLLKKVTSGKATDAEKKQLCELYEALGQNKPGKGTDAVWKAKCDAITDACKNVVAKGDKGAIAALSKATNCKVCHDAHR